MTSGSGLPSTPLQRTTGTGIISKKMNEGLAPFAAERPCWAGTEASRIRTTRETANGRRAYDKQHTL